MTLRAARGGSLLLIFHGWRKPALARDLFNYELTLGFLTVAVCSYCANDRLREIKDLLARIGLEVKP